MKVWITKYALSIGVYEADGELRETAGKFYMVVKGDNPFHMDVFYEKEWHYTKKLAIARAEEMRIKKLQSLNKQIKKLSALKFE